MTDTAGTMGTAGMAGTAPGVAAPGDDLPDLVGKVVVVTGAAGAAGGPLVARLARAGAQVVAVGRSAQRLAPVVASAAQAAADSGRGGGAEVAVVDLLDRDVTARWSRSLLAARGRVDGLFHLVGGWRGGAGIVDSDPGDWDWLQAQLVVTLVHATQALHDGLRDAGGRLAIVSSPQAQEPTATNAAYAAAKAASEAWTLAVADSWRASDAAAVIVQVKALLTDEMRAAAPQRRFPGFAPVDEVSQVLAGLWSVPAEHLNGTRVRLPVA